MPNITQSLEETRVGDSAVVDAVVSDDGELHAASPQDIESIEDIERHLIDIWTEFLDVKHVGVDDDFFKCGGNSLLMVLIITRAQEVLGANFSPDPVMETFFRAPTIRTLAQGIYEALNAPESSGVNIEEGTI